MVQLKWPDGKPTCPKCGKAVAVSRQFAVDFGEKVHLRTALLARVAGRAHIQRASAVFAAASAKLQPAIFAVGRLSRHVRRLRLAHCPNPLAHPQGWRCGGNH